MERPVRVHQVIWGVLFFLSGCGPAQMEPETAQTRYLNFVPEPLRPDNCGTPDHYKSCPPTGMRRVAVAQAKTFVTIEEVGGTPAREGQEFPPEE